MRRRNRSTNCRAKCQWTSHRRRLVLFYVVLVCGARLTSFHVVAMRRINVVRVLTLVTKAWTVPRVQRDFVRSNFGCMSYIRPLLSSPMMTHAGDSGSRTHDSCVPRRNWTSHDSSFAVFYRMLITNASCWLSCLEDFYVTRCNKICGGVVTTIYDPTLSYHNNVAEMIILHGHFRQAVPWFQSLTAYSIPSSLVRIMSRTPGRWLQSSSCRTCNMLIERDRSLSLTGSTNNITLCSV